MKAVQTRCGTLFFMRLASCKAVLFFSMWLYPASQTSTLVKSSSLPRLLRAARENHTTVQNGASAHAQSLISCESCLHQLPFLRYHFQSLHFIFQQMCSPPISDEIKAITHRLQFINQPINSPTPVLFTFLIMGEITILRLTLPVLWIHTHLRKDCFKSTLALVIRANFYILVSTYLVYFKYSHIS